MPRGRAADKAVSGVKDELKKKRFDSDLHDLINIVLGKEYLSADLTSIMDILRKNDCQSMLQKVVKSYKELEPSWSNRKWKRQMAEEAFVRVGQRDQEQAIRAIGEYLQDEMKQGTGVCDVQYAQ